LAGGAAVVPRQAQSEDLLELVEDEDWDDLLAEIVGEPPLGTMKIAPKALFGVDRSRLGEVRRGDCAFDRGLDLGSGRQCLGRIIEPDQDRQEPCPAQARKQPRLQQRGLAEPGLAEE